MRNIVGRCRRLWGGMCRSLVAGSAICTCLSTATTTPAFAEACPNAALRGGPSSALPDCRAYEQVSPVEKGGLSAYPVSGLPAQVSETGNAIAYLGHEAFPGASGNSALSSAHIGRRTPTGWASEDLTPAVPEAHALKSYLVSYFLSPDLSQAVVQAPFVPLAPGATPGAFNLFLRHPGGEYSLINDAPPTLTPAEICPGLAVCYLVADVSQFAGASVGDRRVVFESNAQLTPEAPESLVESAYESDEGHVSLVGILPDKTPASTSTVGAGSRIAYFGDQEVDLRLEHAMSPDGSHILFQAPADEGAPDPAQSGQTELYDRINGNETLEISAPAPGAEANPPASATYAGASEDGSRVFFTSAANLTTESKTGSEGGEDLYEYSLTTHTLKDLTVDTVPADAASGASVQGVIDESTDGSYIYFVAKGELEPGHGTDGQPNVYMVHDAGPPVFVATLDAGGTCKPTAASRSDACVWSQYPAIREAYVTPDGRHLAFMSNRSLPTRDFPGGYDNRDQTTGASDIEVYEYAAPTKSEEEAGGDGMLVCASCDPTGKPPIGDALLGGISLTSNYSGEEGGEEQPHLEGLSTPFYRVRALSENGARLFYTASVPHIEPRPPVKGKLGGPVVKVREYEAAGEGSCTTPGGCQYVISSAGNGESDNFLGANADGSDVYFATATPLTASDKDDLRDVYDARIDGGFTESPAPASCEANCPRERSGIPGATALLTNTTGASGNLVPPSLAAVTSHPPRKAVKRCRKGHVRRHGRCVKVKKHPGKSASRNRPAPAEGRAR